MTADESRDRSPPAPGPLTFDPDDAAEQERRWAHRQDPDLVPGKGGQGAPAPPRPRSPYGWLIALLAGALLIYISINNLGNVGSVPRGLAAGKPMPPFATPLALSRLEGDANVATANGQGQRGERAACTIRGPAILNSCQLSEGAPVVLAFVATGEPSCATQLDRLQRARAAFPGVRFAAVAARTDRVRLRREILRRGWSFPIGFDADGAVFTRYGVVDCPTMIFAYPGAVAMRTTVRPLSGRQLTGMLTQLVDASRRRGWKPPAPV
jgi:hypothetical protein